MGPCAYVLETSSPLNDLCNRGLSTFLISLCVCVSAGDLHPARGLQQPGGTV